MRLFGRTGGQGAGGQGGGGARVVATGGPVLNPAGRAGPLRLAMLAGGALGLAAIVLVVAMSGEVDPLPSRDARAKLVDPLPGGLNTTPTQLVLARVADTQAAETALRGGGSYTPPMAPSRPLRDARPAAETPTTVPEPPMAQPQPAVLRSPPNPMALPEPLRPPPVIPAVWRAPEPVAPVPTPASPPPPIIQVQASAADQAALEAYRRQIGDLFNQWGGRAPRTDVVAPLPRSEPAVGNGPAEPETAVQRLPSRPRPNAVAQALPPDVPRSGGRQVLLPAGRGIYATTILAANSDQASPVVLEATSGPFAGDRMIGSFTRERERFVIRVTQLAHAGETISVNGMVVAPDTLETGVASGVDQRYAERFILPAAAAFVQGLGQAIASTSRVAGVISPFGGVGFTQDLNISQQLGIAAGAAAGRIGQTLNQEVPRGPRITLDAGSQVGVMFLSDVIAGGGG